jgi:hypothetical protein
MKVKAKARPKGKRPFTDEQVNAMIYNTTMRIAMAGAMVLQDTYGLTQQQSVEWWVETARRANPENAGDQFIADKVTVDA